MTEQDYNHTTQKINLSSKAWGKMSSAGSCSNTILWEPAQEEDQDKTCLERAWLTVSIPSTSTTGLISLGKISFLCCLIVNPIVKHNMKNQEAGLLLTEQQSKTRNFLLPLRNYSLCNCKLSICFPVTMDRILSGYSGVGIKS